MWRWVIQCATFINNITATFYRKEKVWATPWEVMHGELFPDSSIVVPFGCAALVLLNKDEREKFKGTCAMMIFIHYAMNHPLYTYAMFSPRTKKVMFRQDVIFLPHVFPMREARVKGGLQPDGEALIAYRPPHAPGTTVEEGMSFGEWTEDDPSHSTKIISQGIHSCLPWMGRPLLQRRGLQNGPANSHHIPLLDLDRW